MHILLLALLFQKADPAAARPAADPMGKYLADLEQAGILKGEDAAPASLERLRSQLAAVNLRITACRAKFKLGQNRPVAARKRVIEELRRRARPNDARAADALQWTIDHPFTPGAADGR